MGLQSFRSMRRIDASRRNASALRLRFSKSLARRRQRLSQAKVRSTTQRIGRTTKPFAWSDRFTISTGELRQDLCHGRGELRSLVAGIGEQLHQEGIHPEQGGQQQHAAVTVLDVRWMHHGMQQQAYRVDQDMPLLTLDLLARVIPGRIDAGPPFSALFTLWLSITQAVGLASRPAASRHCTYSA